MLIVAIASCVERLIININTINNRGRHNNKKKPRTTHKHAETMPPFRQPLQGLLIEHGSDGTRPLSAFLMGAHRRVMVVIGGQLDGFFSLPCVRPLAEALEGRQWSLLLTKLGSTYIGSRDSHVQDAADLKALLDLLQQRFDATEICLFGWDTGVQVVLGFLETFPQSDMVTRVILNGAVVDHTSELACNAGVHRRKEYIEKALVERRRAELLPPTVYDKEITVGRASCGGYMTLQEAVWVPARTGNAATLRDALQSVRAPLLIQVLPGPGYDVPAAVRADVDHFVSSNAASTELYVDFIDESADERRDILQGTEAQHVGSIVRFLESADARRLVRIEAQASTDYETSRKKRSVLHNSDLAYPRK